jgi:hypothetical protein
MELLSALSEFLAGFYCQPFQEKHPAILPSCHFIYRQSCQEREYYLYIIYYNIIIIYNIKNLIASFSHQSIILNIQMAEWQNGILQEYNNTPVSHN